MKQIINIKKQGVFVVLFMLTVLTACNDKNELTKAVSIKIAGYNIGNSELEVSIDEVAYDKSRIQANHLLNFAKVYTYPSGKSQASLKIKDVTSGKEVYQEQLDLSKVELERFFSFVLIDGVPLQVKPQASDPSTNKVAFYIHYPQSSDAVDVFLKSDEGKMAYIAKNVQPSTWAYMNYVTPEEIKDATKNYTLYFTKAGTTDQWAFNDSEYMSRTPIGTLALPKFGEKGLVCSYFVTPGANQLDAVRLLKK